MSHGKRSYGKPLAPIRPSSCLLPPLFNGGCSTRLRLLRPEVLLGTSIHQWRRKMMDCCADVEPVILRACYISSGTVLGVS